MGWRLLSWFWRTPAPVATEAIGYLKLQTRSAASVVIDVDTLGGHMSRGIGNMARLTARFSNAAGVATDPTVVKLKVRTPAGAVTEHVYLTDVALVRDSAGAYHFDLPLLENGEHWVRWVGTGAIVAAEETTVSAQASRFADPL